MRKRHLPGSSRCSRAGCRCGCNFFGGLGRQVMNRVTANWRYGGDARPKSFGWVVPELLTGGRVQTIYITLDGDDQSITIDEQRYVATHLGLGALPLPHNLARISIECQNSRIKADED